jgi:hypothetical protein
MYIQHMTTFKKIQMNEKKNHYTKMKRLFERIYVFFFKAMNLFVGYDI